MVSSNTTTYEHSYITIQIYDNTIAQDVDDTPARKTFNGMQVGFFAGGRDNKIMYMPNQTEYLREFCNPNYKKLGQAAYNADNVLSTGNAGMYILNLRPDTATYSNFILMVRFKLVETDKPEPDQPNVPDEPTPIPGDTEVLPYPYGSVVVNKSSAGNDLEAAMLNLIQPMALADVGEVEVPWDDEEDDTTPTIPTNPDDTTGDGTGDTTGGDDGNKHPDIGEGEVDIDDLLDPDDPNNPDNPDNPTPEDPEEPEQKYYKLEYSFYGKYVNGGNTLDKLKIAAINTMDTELDDDGYFNMPLFMVYALGRGEYGDSIRIRFENDTEYDVGFDVDPPSRHTYKLRVFEPTTEGLKEREINYGTFDEDAFDKSISYGPSLYIQDTVNDVQFGSQRIGMEVYMSTYEAICKLYNEFVSPGAEETPGTLDLFTQCNLDGTINKFLDFQADAEGSVNLLTLDGCQLVGGTDGWDNMSDNQINNTKEELLKEAYRGNIDPVIKSRFSSPCNFNLDAGYTIAVKKEMAALANLRKYDLMTYLDLNHVTTISGLISAAGTMKSIYGYNVVKEGHCYKWRDTEYTGKICNMTITHWLGKQLANHMATVGKGLGLPMARDVASLSSPNDYVPGSFKPVIDPNEDSVIDTLYKHRVNCYTTVKFSTVQRAHAITSCQEKSDRMIEMNEYIVQRAVKITYDILASKLWKIGEQSERDEYEEQANDVLKYQLGPYVRSCTVSFEMTSQDEQKGLLVLNEHIVFKTVIKQGEINLYLDPRVTDIYQSSNSSVITMVS